MGRRSAATGSAELLGQRDDDPFGAADVAEPELSWYCATSPTSSAPRACRPATAASMSSTANMMLRKPSVFPSAFFGSALTAVGVWNFVSSSRP